jgi:hypothetical protein
MLFSDSYSDAALIKEISIMFRWLFCDSSSGTFCGFCRNDKPTFLIKYLAGVRSRGLPKEMSCIANCDVHSQ